MQKYNKAIAAILGGLVSLGAAFGFEGLSEEMIAGLATVLAGVFAYFAPKNTE